MKCTGEANRIMVCLLAGLWNGVSHTNGTRILHMFHEHEQGPGTTQGAGTNASLLLDGTLDYICMEWRLDGRGGDLTTYATNYGGGRGAQIKVSRHMREKGRRRGGFLNLHWPLHSKKYRRASEEISLCSLQSTREVGVIRRVSRWWGRLYVLEEYKMQISYRI